MMSFPINFNAGKVIEDPETKICTSDPTPGEIIIDHSPEGEGCFSFKWQPRSSSHVGEPDELLVFQGDVVWRRLHSCTSGRVYVLAFRSSGAKHMYWLQDVNDLGAGEDDDDTALSTPSESELAIAETINKTLCEV
ncbi:hypothetical protein CANINC_001053 [Pichia inconspicua]|uniref:Uncharacterized protein n=1 Tax=Pichia inconspicua TaxID=52247 RepID=A0A4T0X4H8_9ASCO|nr:hypothetical protein CANINC_001053 [[Candida] inconspicua]